MKSYSEEYGKEGSLIKDVVRSIMEEGPGVFLRRRGSAHGSWSPLSDIFEKDNQFLISMDLPGINISDVSIVAEENTLTISGSRQKPNELTDECCYRNERMFGNFERVFNMPANIDKEKIEAKYSDGVLSVILPKLPESQKKAIKINISKNTK